MEWKYDGHSWVKFGHNTNVEVERWTRIVEGHSTTTWDIPIELVELITQAPYRYPFTCHTHVVGVCISTGPIIEDEDLHRHTHRIYPASGEVELSWEGNTTHHAHDSQEG